MARSKENLITDAQIQTLKEVYKRYNDNKNLSPSDETTLKKIAAAVASSSNNQKKGTIAHAIVSDDSLRYAGDIQAQEVTTNLGYLWEIGKAALSNMVWDGQYYQVQIIKMLNECINAQEDEKLINIADKDGNTPLHYIATDPKKANLITELIADKINADIDKRNKNDRTPCFEAVASGEFDNAVRLIEKFRNDNAISLSDLTKVFHTTPDTEGKTMLHVALENSYLSRAIIFLSNVQRLNCPDAIKIVENSTDADGRTLLHAAAAIGKENYIKLLLQNTKLNIDELDNMGMSPLHIAAFEGNLSAVKALVKGIARKKANINLHSKKQAAQGEEALSISVIDSDGYTPLEYAVMKNRAPIIEFLLTQKDLVLHNKYINDLINFATRLNQAASIRCLINHKLKDTTTPTNEETKPNYIIAIYDTLEYASKLPNANVLKVLIEDAIKNNQNARELMLRAAYEGNFTIVRYLLEKHKISIDLQDTQFKATALYYFAVKHKNVSASKYLISKGARTDIKDKQPQKNDSNTESTVIDHLSSSKEKQSFEILLHIVLYKIADKEKKLDKSCIYYAIKYGMQKEALALAHNLQFSDSEEKKKVEKEQAEILQLAIKKGMRDVVIALLPKRTLGQSALSCAIQNKLTDIAKFLISFALKEEKAEIFKGVFQYLSEAIKQSETEVATALIEFLQADSKNKFKILESAKNKLFPNFDKDIRSCCEAALKAEQHDVANQILKFYQQYNSRNLPQPILHLAVRHLGLNIVKHLIEVQKVDINKKDNPSKETALYYAVFEGKIEIIEFLLSQKALQPSDSKKQKKLIELTILNETNNFITPAQQLSIVQNLLKHEWNHTKKTEGSQFDALTFAVERGYTQACEFLLKQKASIEETLAPGNPLAESLLHIAARNGNLDICKLLLNNNYNIDAVDEKGKTPLHLAIENKHNAVSALLIKKNCNVNMQDKEDKTPLHICAKLGLVTTVGKILGSEPNINLQDKDGNTPLHIASSKNTVPCQGIAALLSSQAELNIQNKKDQTPLHIAIENECYKTANILIEKKADINIYDNDGNNPNELFAAKEKKSNDAYKTLEAAFQKLLEASAKSQGSTLLHRAILKGSSSTVIKQYINNQSINAVDDAKKKPLYYAVKRYGKAETKGKKTETDKGQFVKLLLERSDILEMTDVELLEVLSIACEKNATPIIDPLLKFADNAKNKNRREGKKSILEIQDKSGKTLLHKVVVAGKNKAVAALIGDGNKAAKTKVNAPDNDQRIPLHYAAKAGNIEVMALLIKNKGNVDNAESINKQDNKGNTPLHYAIMGGHTEAIELLAKTKDININATNTENESVINTAIQKNLSYKAVKPILDNKKFTMTGKQLEGYLAIMVANPAQISFFKDFLIRNIEQQEKKKKKTAAKFNLRKDNYGLLNYCIEKYNDIQYALYLINNDQALDLKNSTLDVIQPLLNSAIANNKLEIIKAIALKLPDQESKVKPESITKQKALYNTALFAIEKGKPEIVLEFMGHEQREREKVDNFNKVEFTSVKFSTTQVEKLFMKALNMERIEKQLELLEILASSMDPRHRKAYVMAALQKAVGDGNESLFDQFINYKGVEFTTQDLQGLISIALQYGKPEQLTALIQKTPSIFCQGTPDKASQLSHKAAAWCDVATIEYLSAQEKFDINAKDKESNIPVYYAIYAKNQDAALHILESMDLTKLKSDQKDSLLSAAANRDNVEFIKNFINKEAELGKENQDIYKIIEHAIKEHSYDIVQFLLKGSKLSEKQIEMLACVAIKEKKLETLKCFINNGNKQKLLYLACEYGNIETVQYFTETLGMDVKVKKEGDVSLLHIASSGGNIKVMHYLQGQGLNHSELKDSNGRYTLHHAALCGKLDMVKQIINEYSIAPALTDIAGRNTLHYAAFSNNKTLIDYLINEKKISVNSKDKHGKTPLYYAIVCGSKDIVLHLINKHSADLNAEDNNKNTAFHHAVQFVIEALKVTNNRDPSEISRRIEIAQTLLKKCTKLDGKNDNNKTPLDLLNSAQTQVSEQKMKFINDDSSKEQFNKFVTNVTQKSEKLTKEEKRKEKEAVKAKANAKQRNYAVLGSFLALADAAAALSFIYTFGISIGTHTSYTISLSTAVNSLFNTVGATSILGEAFAAAGVELGAITLSHAFLTTTALYGTILAGIGIGVAALLIAPYAIACVSEIAAGAVSLISNVLQASYSYVTSGKERAE